MKLNDLKIKELRKQVPNTKLKPLHRKDKANMSVDTKLNEEFESLIEEPKKVLPNSKPKMPRKIIRDGSQKVIPNTNSASDARKPLRNPPTKSSRNEKRPNTITRSESEKQSARNPPSKPQMKP